MKYAVKVAFSSIQVYFEVYIICVGMNTSWCMYLQAFFSYCTRFRHSLVCLFVCFFCLSHGRYEHVLYCCIHTSFFFLIHTRLRTCLLLSRGLYEHVLYCLLYTSFFLIHTRFRYSLVFFSYIQGFATHLFCCCPMDADGDVFCLPRFVRVDSCVPCALPLPRRAGRRRPATRPWC